LARTQVEIYLDDAKIGYQNDLSFRYQTQSVEYIQGIVPWVYGYREIEYYILNFTSTSDLELRLDQLRRERIEFLIIDSEITDFFSEEMYLYGNPCYRLRFDLSQPSQVSLGLGLRNKVWFLRPSSMRLEDIPQSIKETYLNPTSSYDGEYIDKDQPIVQLWAKQIVGNETNPYYIAFRLYQNLTDSRSLNYSEEYRAFQVSKEYASHTLQQRRGVCRHLARAYVALCMASGLPARTVIGTAFGHLNESYKKNHEWTEVYFPKYGWVSVDVTWDEFGVLPDSHALCTYWRYVNNTLKVSKLEPERLLLFANRSVRVLSDLIETIILSDLHDERKEISLEQAKTLIQQKCVHEAFMLISAANAMADQSNQIFSVLSHPIVSALVGGAIVAVVSWLIHSRTRKYEVTRDHFEDLKKLVIRPWLKTMENSRFDFRDFESGKPSTFENRVDVFLYEDLVSNHYPKIEEVWQRLLEVAKNRDGSFDNLANQTSNAARTKASDSGLDWFDVEEYKDLFTDTLLYYGEGRRSWPKQKSEQQIVEGKTRYKGKIGGWDFTWRH